MTYRGNPTKRTGKRLPPQESDAKSQPYSKESDDYSGAGVVRPPEEQVGKSEAEIGLTANNHFSTLLAVARRGDVGNGCPKFVHPAGYNFAFASQHRIESGAGDIVLVCPLEAHYPLDFSE